MSLVFKRDESIKQLVEATGLLINEAIEIFGGINQEELNVKELSQFSKSLINRIEKTSMILDALESVPNEQIIECRLQLQIGIDKLYVQLTNIKSEWAERVLLGEATNSELIDYGNFCFELALKLINRVSQSVIESAKAPPEIKLLLDEDEDY